MPKISVIIPTYNRSHLIQKTINSILAQDFDDFEIIVVSNGSTDNTKEIVESYNDRRISFIHQTASGSPASPRNHGIRLAKCKYIAFCDDDDVWEPNKLKKQYSFMENNSDYGACFTKMKRFNEDKEWINPDEESDFHTHSLSLLKKNTVPLSSLFVKKDIINSWFDEDPKIFGAEDFELVLRISKVTKMYRIPEYLIRYYSGNVRYSNHYSNSNFFRNIKYIKRIFWVYWKIYKKGFFSPKELFAPFCQNVKTVSKIILYDLKCTVLPNRNNNNT